MYRFSDVQIRLIILFTMKAYKLSISEANLTEIIVWNNILDYFTLMDFVLELEDDHMITAIHIENEKRYDLAPKGEEAVSLFYDKIPHSIRDMISDCANDALDFLETGLGIKTSIEPYDTRRFSAKCGIYERGIPMLELTLMAGSRKQAHHISEIFKNKAEEIYTMLLDKVTEENED